MINGLLWCLAVLAGQLWLLHLVDRRVASMSRLPPEDLTPPDDPLGGASPPA
ncbi:hypothetical protein M8009_01195 [Halomonas sp. ATCH28]|uniref:Uncharacterized protein n=1 Tax=Halomonas gemina TaxID=2945105 RepID=A0ABT0SW79_9GAMM|nr:hypothetical protein [Halomonas gemina]MCL7938919.1 hypothetical protein [Halomonas gemina]